MLRLRSTACSARLSGALLAALLLAGGAAAHDFWIAPASWQPHTGTLLAVPLFVGDHARGDPVVRKPERIVRFVLVGPDGETPVVGQDGRAPAGLVRLRSPGPHVLGYLGNGAYIELEPAKFEAYLAEEGLQDVLAARAASGRGGEPGREVYSRCAKALIRVRDAAAAAAGAAGASAAAGDAASTGDAAGNAATDAPFDQPLGFTLELIAETDPYTLARTGSALAPFRVRLLHEGRPLEHALIKASLFVANPAPAPSSADAGATGSSTGSTGAPRDSSVAAPVLPFDAPAGIGLQARSDAEGRATFVLPRPGTWLLTAVHMLPAAPGTRPDTAPATPPSTPATPPDNASAASPTASPTAPPGASPGASPGAPATADLPTADWESLWASLTFEL